MKNLVLIIFFSLLLGCEKSSDGIDPKPFDIEKDMEKEDWCSIWHSERQIVEELEEVEGKVIYLKKCEQWVLTGSSGDNAPGRLYNYLGPCNLPEEFKVDGAAIFLSGYVYGEIEDEELLSFCAQAFEITEIKFKN